MIYRLLLIATKQLLLISVVLLVAVLWPWQQRTCIGYQLSPTLVGGVQLRIPVRHLQLQQYHQRLPHQRLRILSGAKNSRANIPSAASPSVGTSPVVLKCTALSKKYTDTPQFEDVSFTLTKGQRMGLIGKNGAGKSTLLRILASIDSPDSGSVSVPHGITVAYLDQEMGWDTNISVFEALFHGDSPVERSVSRYFSIVDPALLSSGTGSGSGVDEGAFVKILAEMDETGGWDLQFRATTYAAKLGVGEEFLYRKLSTLSGGQVKRIGLAAALAKQPDVLLLDEVA
jgi:ABC-type dipeptide/oligopeptide/nickel transport system ATPase subunit